MSKVHIVVGAQGAGKSTYSKKLADEINGVHLSIDDWMGNLFGDDLPKSINLKWIMERVERCEKQIWSTAKKISGCGIEVILDLGFTKYAKRKLFRSLIEEQGLPIQEHYINAPLTLRRKRVLQRNIDKGETFSFEVTPGMFDFMEGEFDRPSEEEQMGGIIVDTNDK